MVQGVHGPQDGTQAQDARLCPVKSCHNKILFKASNLKPPIPGRSHSCSLGLLEWRCLGVFGSRRQDCVCVCVDRGYQSLVRLLETALRGGFTTAIKRHNIQILQLAHCCHTLSTCMLFFAQNRSNHRFGCRYKTRESGLFDRVRAQTPVC